MPKPFVIALSLLLAAATPLHAAPDAAPGDAVVQMLQQRGILPTASQLDANPIVQQMRDVASDMVLSAMNFLGVPYRLGGNTAEQGFDCSGFTRYVFENSLGLVLPRRADQQAQNAGLLKIRREELKPGDLVFFNTMRRAFSHVGIYIGEGRFIHAPRTGAEVRIEDMRQAYWSKRFNGARRAESAAMTPAPKAAPAAAAAAAGLAASAPFGLVAPVPPASPERAIKP
ncbi:MAG: C40 family peptidase [Rubrivivax sp.]|jgi:cell wall-associated NlpC family hydrolase|nr:C40 family peptidase [Rubrivivax sp.]